MSEDFNPYVEWLGYAVGQRPASHYDLLDIDSTEQDPQAIAHAADVLTSRIRKIRPGAHVAQWQRLLDVVGSAKICLLDPVARAAYDAQLIQETSAEPAETSLPPDESPSTPAASISVAPRGLKRRRSPVGSFLLATFGTIAVLLAVAYGVSVYQQRQAVDRPAVASDSPKVARRTTPGVSLPDERTSSSGESPRRRPPTEANPPTPSVRPTDPSAQPPTLDPARPLNPTKQAAFTRSVAAARSAMSQRDLESARTHLTAAGDHVQTPAEQAEFDRLDTLLGHLDGFWAGLRRELAALQGLEEFTINNAVILVVESSADRITVRAVGQNRSYMWFETPHSLVMTLVERGFANDGPSKVLIGSYLAFDPKGDRNQAGVLWREAARMGVDVDGLTAELDERPPTLEGSSGSGATASNGPPPSSLATLAAAQRTVQERFQSEYDGATDMRRQAALAEKLLNAAAQSAATGEDSVVCYVMITEARDLAITAGQPATALQAIEMAAGVYSIDVVQMNLAALEGVALNVRGLTAQREIVAGALTTLDEAVASKRTDEARRLVKVAMAAAVASKNAQILGHVRAVAQRVESMQ